MQTDAAAVEEELEQPPRIRCNLPERTRRQLWGPLTLARVSFAFSTILADV